MGIALAGLEPDPKGYIRECFLDGDITHRLRGISELTNTLSDESNIIMNQIAAIVSLPNFDGGAVRESIWDARIKRDQLVFDLNEVDANRTSTLVTIESDSHPICSKKVNVIGVIRLDGITLYHVLLSEDHQHCVSQEEVLTNGIKHTTTSNYFYGNGGGIELEITEKLKPFNTPEWVDFERAIGVDLTNRFSKSFCFPISTTKLRVFDGEISMNIYDQAFYEDLKGTDVEALNFDTGKSLEHWIEKYWESMVTLEQYIQKSPYSNPEILIFKDVPKDLIKVCEIKKQLNLTEQ